MDILRCTRRLCLVMLSGWSCALSAQEKTAKVPQVLPFASSGAVTTETKAATPPEETTSGSAAAAPVKDTTGLLTQAGGRISTAQDGSTSLVIGTLGSARMGADSEVKVPDAGESGHSLELLKGQLFMNISADELKKRNEGEFKLKTPAALLAVKGTRFFTLSRADGDTIGVHHGSVVVTEPESGKSVTLEAGYAVTASPGSLSEARALTEDETKLATEYDLAALKAMPVPAVAHYRDRKIVVAAREGKIVQSSIGLHRLSSFDPCILLERALLDKDGQASALWLGSENNPANLFRLSNQKLEFSFRGRTFEKMPALPDAPPVLKLAALRLRYRTKTISSLNLLGNASHNYSTHGADGRMKLQQPETKNIIRLIHDDDWHELILPLRTGPFYDEKNKLAEGFDFAAEDISLTLTADHMLPPGSNQGVVRHVFYMKDFEVLIIP